MNKDSIENIREPLGRKLKRISLLSQACLQEHLTGLDINHSFHPLLLIEAGNGMTQQELAQKLSCDKVQVVRIVNYLSSKGYVVRIQSKNDKRKYELQITEKAAQIIPEIKIAFQKNEMIMLNDLSGNQVSELFSMLTKIEMNILQNKILLNK
jgi:DNA-binding MarR family transcriptional regulator